MELFSSAKQIKTKMPNIISEEVMWLPLSILKKKKKTTTTSGVHQSAQHGLPPQPRAGQRRPGKSYEPYVARSLAITSSVRFQLECFVAPTDKPNTLHVSYASHIYEFEFVSDASRLAIQVRLLAVACEWNRCVEIRGWAVICHANDVQNGALINFSSARRSLLFYSSSTYRPSKNGGYPAIN